jgi:5-formyltetrahydrofolate cyclo-ligase
MSGKWSLREEILADRVAMTAADRDAADEALVAAACALVRGAERVAAYVPLPGEPGGVGLAGALMAVLPPSGLLLPALRPDRDLDWAAHDGSLVAGATLGRLREPAGVRLGVAAIATADVVLVPALAVDRLGTRLGRGGGSYDRALARVRPGVPVVALLYPGEIMPELPVEPHDRPVTAALTPAGLVRLGPESVGRVS